MPRTRAQKKGTKAKSSKQADVAVLRAQLQLARAERAKADEKIQRSVPWMAYLPAKMILAAQNLSLKHQRHHRHQMHQTPRVKVI